MEMKQFTGTKTIKACPMPLGVAEKVLGRKIDVTAVENRESEEGYLVEYEDGYRSWSPKTVFEKAYRISETHIDRMMIEKEDLEKRYMKARRFTFSEKFASLNKDQRYLLRKYADQMESSLYTLIERIGVEKDIEQDRLKTEMELNEKVDEMRGMAKGGGEPSDMSDPVTEP